MKKIVLLRSLSLEYQFTIFALKAVGLSTITFHDMIQLLKETEAGLREQEFAQDENLVRETKQRHESFEMTRERKDKKHMECFYCHKKGHLRRDCWVLNGKPCKKKPLPPSRRTTDHVAAAW
ncbi:hypothetical protein M433DRAFT_450242 [Acidomyces richmondensis BFW]|nr:MAG: hypothetical protein FE78DRAFT_459451 [Acidomyces sp. 'richmondensis']KYG41840.1 hypothetical protein M433DRAFT_450242 [Acidomyces richmondensis BFW]